MVKPTATPGKKPHRRKTYSQALKQKVRLWKIHKNMKPTDIQKKLQVEDNLTVTLSTLAGWWSPKVMQQIETIASDRLNVPDVRHNPKQRPDVLVGMEHILAQKISAIKLHGLPYSRDILQVLAIHVFEKLLSYGLYNEQGHRKNPGQPIEEDMLKAIEKARLTTNYLAKSTRKTEFHKSFDISRNAAKATNSCKFCRRSFQDVVNLTLHVYYHAVDDNRRKGVPEEPMHEDNSASEEEDDEILKTELGIKASPG